MNTKQLEDWLRQHPHLEELARLHHRIEEILQELDEDEISLPELSELTQDALPVLHRQHLAPQFFTQAGASLRQLMERLPDPGLPQGLNHQCQLVQERFQQAPAEAEEVITKQVEGGHAQGNEGGEQVFFRFFSWMILRKFLLPLRDLVQERLEQQDIPLWQEPYCPFCGHGPALAQLKSTRGGRRRHLVCGSCGLTWGYQRTGCPYCGTNEQDQQAILELKEGSLRIDLCKQCKGFLKTIVSAKNAEILALDWTSLHADALAVEQGWQRRADSLYSL